MSSSPATGNLQLRALTHSTFGQLSLRGADQQPRFPGRALASASGGLGGVGVQEAGLLTSTQVIVAREFQDHTSTMIVQGGEQNFTPQPGENNDSITSNDTRCTWVPGGLRAEWAYAAMDQAWQRNGRKMLGRVWL